MADPPLTPGWYPAPSAATAGDGALLRGWDGARWTEHVALACDHLAWPPPGWGERLTVAAVLPPTTLTEGLT